MSGGEDMRILVTWAGIASDHLGAAAGRIANLSDAEFHALLKELATQDESDVNAMIAGLCLRESTARFLKLTTPPKAPDA